MTVKPLLSSRATRHPEAEAEASQTTASRVNYPSQLSESIIRVNYPSQFSESDDGLPRLRERAATAGGRGGIGPGGGRGVVLQVRARARARVCVCVSLCVCAYPDPATAPVRKCLSCDLESILS